MKKISRHITYLLITFVLASNVKAQSLLDSLLPVRGLTIGLPRPSGLDSFIHFIDTALPARLINTLVLSVEYSYRYKSHPELTDSFALSEKDVKKIVSVCRKHQITLIPQIDLLGHQSWASRLNRLLKIYPELDETPWVKMPDNYVWPNTDNLYCKSYCPLHPQLHPIIFALIDELCDVFETKVFHAGMDEVFYLGEDKCPRCGGRDKAVLFADEVRCIHDHLAEKGRSLWIWGDRLLDGKTTGLGIWEASFNNTYRAIDMIPKDVTICDWHYDRPDKTAVYFAMKGFKVITCPWRDPGVALAQVRDMVNFRKESTVEMREKFAGVMETTWTRTSTFIQQLSVPAQPGSEKDINSWNCFRIMFDAVNSLGH